jgi:Cu+-exporting ATPase
VLKPEAAATVSALRTLGTNLVLLTGDNRATAAAIARQAGIDRVMAEVLPQARPARFSAYVPKVVSSRWWATASTTRRRSPRPTSGSRWARERTWRSRRGDLRAVLRAIALSRRTIRVIKQNLGWAFGYNVSLIPVAAGVLYPLWGVCCSRRSSWALRWRSHRSRW